MSVVEVAAITTALGSVTAAVLPKVLPMAFATIKEVLKKWEGREDDVRTLESQLSYIQGVICDTRKIITSVDDPSGTLQSWAANLRCLAYDIEDLIASHRAKTMTGAKLNGKITIIQDLVNNCNKTHQLFMMIPNEAPHQSGASSSTSSPQIISSNPQRNKDDDDVFPLVDLVGKEEHLREILDLVRRPDTPLGTNDLNLKVMVISVVGFGGIGETKLCHRVYRDVERHGKFTLYAFVSAAGKDGNTVLEEINQKFLDQDSNGGNTSASGGIFHRVIQTFGGNSNRQVQQYTHGLAQRLRHKRYFIMVDDVESEEMITFITSVFPENNMGSRIIMGMTVVGKDAERCDGYMCKMKPLQDEMSVTRFLNEAEQRPTIKFQEQDRSSSCLQKICDGVPLALVSVCEVRRGSITAAAGVEEACRELRRAEEDRWPHRMPVVLPHSYDSLHIRSVGSYQNQYMPYLQACLLYFTMFPRGNVKRGSLIRRWQAEGLQFGGNNIHNKAAENLKTLVDRNFVWPLHVSMNEHQHPKTCQPPRVVLDYISRMSEMEEFILKSCPGGDLTPNHSRRLCLHPPEKDKPEPSVITNGCVPPRLRTLAVSWGHQQACRIVECEQLRVLDLQQYPGLEATQLEEICQKLRLLKYLSLLPDIITELPTSMSNLKCLETLELGEVKGKAAVLVPIEVISLPCIKHLIGKFELLDSLHKIPNRFWVRVPTAIKKSNLERISGFFTRRGQGFPPLMCHMSQLRKVKIWFHRGAYATSLTTYLPKAITKFLKNDNIDRSLSLDFQDCPSPGELLLASLDNASGKLYSLKLSGKNLSNIHYLFDTKLTGITKLCLSWKTIKLDANFLDELSKLNQLKYLKLNAETIKGAYDVNPQAGNNHEKVVIETLHIKNLERLCLVAKETLPDIEIKPRALQQLVSLHVISEDSDNCPSPNMICKANGQDDQPLTNLRELAMNATVPEESRNPWHEAARNHPKRPQILFIQHPHRAG